MSGLGPQPSLVMDPNLPWDVSQPSVAEDRLSALREQLLDEGGECEKAIETSTQVARAQALQGRFDDASRTLDFVARTIDPRWSVEPKLRLLLERGRLQVMRKTPTVARLRFEEAYELAVQAGADFYAVDAAQMMSSIAPRAGKLPWTLRALEIAEASRDERTQVWLGPIHATLGAHFAERLRLPEALAHVEAAATFFERSGSVRQANVSHCEIARILRMMHRAAEALSMLRRLESELASHGAFDGLVSEEIGECLSDLGRTEEAVEYFGRAYDALSTNVWLADNQPERLRRLRNLGGRKRKL